jgi:hypothetical protein
MTNTKNAGTETTKSGCITSIINLGVRFVVAVALATYFGQSLDSNVKPVTLVVTIVLTWFSTIVFGGFRPKTFRGKAILIVTRPVGATLIAAVILWFIGKELDLGAMVAIAAAMTISTVPLRRKPKVAAQPF